MMSKEKKKNEWLLYTRLLLTTFTRIILFNPYNHSMAGGGKLFV